MTCDFTKYRSQTLFWDAMNYKAWHPETIDYSINIENVPSGKKIIWDNSEHIINNVNNYSYSLVPIINKRFKTWGFRRDYFSNKPSDPVTGTWTDKTSILIRDWEGGHSTRYPKWCELGEVRLTAQRFITSGMFSVYIYIRMSDGGRLASALISKSANSTRTVGVEISFDRFEIDNNADYNLLIIDNNIEYLYGIDDINSIEIVDITGEEIKSIIVNGNTFILNDADSIDLVCTDPVSRCPENTIECNCGDVILCLVPSEKGYQIVSCLDI